MLSESIELRGLARSYPGVQALADGSLTLRRGEIHGLVGENGAGKSTLVRILTGATTRDAGAILMDGTPVRFASPRAARRAGIAVIHQEFSLVPALTVAANLFLGRERTRRGAIDTAHETAAARRIFARLGVDIAPGTPIASLGVGERQLVEIARALLTDAAVLVMDEPTAALAPREVERLFALLRDLAVAGLAVLFIGHRLDEVFAISSRITVMRDGRTVGTFPSDRVTRREVIELMVGRKIEEEFPARTARTVPASGSTPRLEVRGLSAGRVCDVSFAVGAGEIVGLAGLMGAGRTEALRALFGADARDTGEVRIDGRVITPRSPRDAVRAGLAFLSEDRKVDGLVLVRPVIENFSLPSLADWSRAGWLRRSVERSRFGHAVASLGIRISNGDQRAGELSGGNQQKLLVGRWLERPSAVILFDEPTRGIDVGARAEMYGLMRRLADEGRAIVMASSDLGELLGMCDRILVFRGGRIAGEVRDVPATTREDVMALAV